MKKLGIRSLKPLYIVLAIVLGIILIGVSFDFLSTGQLVIPADECEDVLGCTAEEFFDKELDFYNEVGDFRKRARINKQGDLVLRLTQVQANAWCLSLQEDVRNAEKQYNIEVSDDYSTITIYGYKETVYRDVVKAQELEAKNVLIRSFKRQDYLCNLIIKDGLTGKIVWSDDMYDPDQFDYIVRNYKYGSIIEKESQ